jgi:preprotein translocase subunit SecD
MLVQLPGVKDINQAIKLIGQVALLEFKEQQLDANGAVVNDAQGQPVWIPATGTATDGTQQELTGKYLKPNSYVTTSSAGQPEVAFEFNSDGSVLFQQITGRLIQKPLGIFLTTRWFLPLQCRQ